MEKYIFTPYSETFPQLFAAEKERIAPHLKGAVIEHVGSTAVPGLGGKGIIDIAVAVRKEDLQKVCGQLQDLGYLFKRAYSTRDRLFFKLGLTYHLHLSYPESNEWKQLIAFRDYLRTHSEAAEEYAKVKQDAASQAAGEGQKYRMLKEHFFKKYQTRDITFKKASLTEKENVLRWLKEPHVKEFWDTSPENILNFMNGRKEPSSYSNGIFTYWIGLCNNVPFSLIMTSEITPTEGDLPELWESHLSETGNTLRLDFMIGNPTYLEQGLSAPTLEAFIQFYSKEIDPLTDTYFIDPGYDNLKARHVYKKAGFNIVGEFLRNDAFHLLMVKKQSS